MKANQLSRPGGKSRPGRKLSRKPARKLGKYLALLAALALFAAACGSDDDDANAQDAAAAQDAADEANEANAAREEEEAGTADDDTEQSDADDPADDSETTDSAEAVDGSAGAQPGNACQTGGQSPSINTSVTVTGGSGDSEFVNSYNYELYVPSGYNGAPTPLVVNFHGLGSNGLQQQGYTAYDQVAEEEGFIVAYPTGLPSAQGLNSWELPQFDEESRDDVAFVRALIGDIGQWVCVDESRIYSTGMSNGGFFSAIVACELADVFAATFSVAGMTHPEGCVPSQPIAMGFIHGTADDVVPYIGTGTSTLLTLLEQGSEAYITAEEFFSQSMPDEIAEFAADMGCDEITETAHSADTQLRRFAGCDDPNVEVVFYTVQDGGHVWPGAEATINQSTLDFDASRDGWAFLSQFTLISRP